MSPNQWIVAAVLAFVLLNWIAWKIRRAMRNEPPSGEINYTQMFNKSYPVVCAKCGSRLTRYGCWTCWKEYGA